MFLRRGVNIEARDADGSTLFHSACRIRDENAVRSLLSHGANPNANNFHQLTPSDFAVIADQTDILRLLLLNGADIESQDNHWRTPLYLTSTRGHEATVSVLLEYGAKFTTHRHWIYTPLSVAILQGSSHYWTVALLLAGGSDPNSADDLLYQAVRPDLPDIR